VASIQATDEKHGGGFRARAGALTLLYLSSPLERPVLRTLMAELTTGVKMQEIGPPDPEFMRMGIFEDPYLLEPADPDHPPGEPIGPDTLLQPTPAGNEVPFVGAVLADWLRRCPQGPLEQGPESGRQMAALLGGWASMTIHALAGGPRSAAQVCEAIQVIDREAIDARIDSMLATGLLEQAPGEDPDGEPLVRATEWLRRAVAPLAVAARMELRFPPGDTAPIAALDVEAALQLTLPLLKLPRRFRGACSLAVELAEGVAGSPAGVTARIEDGSVVACKRGLDPNAQVAVSGDTGAWLDAVIDRRTERISSSGERRLAKRILRELHRTLFKGVAPLKIPRRK
jgi:hypothetical protein